MQRLPRFVAQQIHYTLEAREAEYELLPIAIDQGVGIMVWGPLTSGLLSGVFSRQKPPKWRGPDSNWSGPPIRDEERLWAIVDLIKNLAEEHHAPMAHIALSWVLGRPGVASVVVGGLTENHFRENIAAIDVKLNAHDMARLNDISRLPNLYPYWHHRRFAEDRLGPADWALHANY